MNAAAMDLLQKVRVTEQQRFSGRCARAEAEVRARWAGKGYGSATLHELTELLLKIISERADSLCQNAKQIVEVAAVPSTEQKAEVKSGILTDIDNFQLHAEGALDMLKRRHGSSVMDACYTTRSRYGVLRQQCSNKLDLIFLSKEVAAPTSVRTALPNTKNTQKHNSPMRPTAFISYSWDDEDHKRWVATLGTRLRADGVDVQLDQWHAAPGDQLPEFMEREIRTCDFVIAVCTPCYKVKSEGRTGGAGYEGHIMTAELFTKNNHRKFIPVLARGAWLDAAPSWLAGKYHVNLSDAAKSDANYRDLLNTILGTRTPPPPLGTPNSEQPSVVAILPTPASLPSASVKVLGVVIDEVTEPRNDGTPGSALYRVPFRLSNEPSPTWAEFFLAAWKCPRSCTLMHRPGIASVNGKRIILDGTTVEEVERYHKDTLEKCVQDANQNEADFVERTERARAKEQQIFESHRKNVRDVASRLKFDDQQ